MIYTSSCILDLESALEMGQHLINQHFGHHLSQDAEFRADDTYYRLLEDDESTALNSGATSPCEPKPGRQLQGSLPHYL